MGACASKKSCKEPKIWVKPYILASHDNQIIPIDDNKTKMEENNMIDIRAAA